MKNVLFNALVKKPTLSKREMKKRRKEAGAELEREKDIRRALRQKDIQLWKEYKEKTKEKIQHLLAITLTK